MPDAPATATPPSATVVAAPGAPAMPPGLDVNAKVNVGGKEITVGELIQTHSTATQTAARAAALQKNWDAAQALTNPNLDNTQFEGHLRTYLNAANLSPEQVNAAVADAMAGRTAAATPPPARNGQGKGVSPETDAALGTMARELQNTRVSMLKAGIEGGIATALASDGPAGVLLRKSVELSGEQGQGDLKATLTNEIRMASIAELTKRNAATGSIPFDEVPQIVRDATAAVVKKMTGWAGDLSTMGKAPKVAGLEGFDMSNVKPVARPEHKKGADNSAVIGQLDSWIQDSLMRGMAENAAAGISKA